MSLSAVLYRLEIHGHMHAPVCEEIRLLQQLLLDGGNLLGRKIVALLFLEFAWRNVNVDPGAIVLQAVSVTTMDGFEVGATFELCGLSLGQQPDQTESTNAVAATQRNDVHKLMSQNRTNAI